jgi:hypothetical protein
MAKPRTEKPENLARCVSASAASGRRTAFRISGSPASPFLLETLGQSRWGMDAARRSADTGNSDRARRPYFDVTDTAHAATRKTTWNVCWENTGTGRPSPRRLRFHRAPLLVPEDVAVAVEANSGCVVRLRVDLHHELGLHDELIASAALLPVPWTAEHSRADVTRQTSVLELLPDEKTDAVWVYGCLATRGCGHRDEISPRHDPKKPKFRKLA